MKSRRLFRLLLLFSIAAAVQTISAERLPIKIYTSADGLGSGFVDFLYRDKRGFMWFCTRDGLSRFDGSQFQTFKVGSDGRSPGIESIYETRDGDFWVSTTNGTYRFNPTENAQNGKSASDLNAEYVTGARGWFFEDSNGSLWLASGTLMRLEVVDGKRTFVTVDWRIPQRQNTTFSTYVIAEGDDRSIWLLTSWGLARKLPDGRLVNYRFKQTLYGGIGAVSMIVDKAGRVWISLLNDIYILKPEPISSLPESNEVIQRDLSGVPQKIGNNDELKLPKVGGEIVLLNFETFETSSNRRIFQSSDGNIWITAGDHLFQVDGGKLHVHTSAEGLPDSMSRMEQDAAGNLWIGGTSVLARLDRNGMVTFDRSDGAYTSRFNSVTQAPDGTLYFANADAYVTKLEGTELIAARPNLPDEVLHLWMSKFLKVDSTGDFWLLSGGALYRYSGIKDVRDLNGRAPTRTYGVADGLKSDGMFQIYEDRYGDIWMSTRGANNLDHGLSRLKKGAERFEAFSEADGLPARQSPTAFAEDRNGTLWMTFYEGGLAKFDGERFTYYQGGDKIPEGLLSDIHVDARGRLWVSSALTGLIRIDDPSARDLNAKLISTKDGLSSNNIRTLAEDRFGRLYLGTASGVDCLSPETGHVKHYSVNDGLAADFVVDSTTDRDGNVWFVTTNGVSRLIPRYDDSVVVPKIFIGGLRINGVDQPVSNLGSTEISRSDLTHNESNVEIEFFGIDFRAGESLRYQYKLEGADSDWSAPTSQRNVTFGNLSPASYRFLVRAVSSDDVPSDAPAVVTFRILPPIWARWWFVTIALGLTALLGWSFYRYRVARLREVNAALEDAKLAEENLRKSREERLAELEQVRSRIATDLHDDIGASLTQIAILSEVAQAQSKNGASEPLQMITAVSNELVGTMSDIVWSINPTKDHLSDLTQRMRRFASDVLTAKGIGLVFNASHSDDAITVNSNIRREVFLIFKEGVNNVVKHSEATRVIVDVSIIDDRLNVWIRDDGRGFNEPKSPIDADGGNGIPSMRRRAKEMRGEFEIASGNESGTVVRFAIPLEPATHTGGEAVR